MREMIQSSRTAQIDCNEIYDIYGHSTPGTQILKSLKRVLQLMGAQTLAVLFL